MVVTPRMRSAVVISVGLTVGVMLRIGMNLAPLTPLASVSAVPPWVPLVFGYSRAPAGSLSLSGIYFVALPLLYLLVARASLREASFGAGLRIGIPWVLLDVVADVANPLVGSGIRWTTPLLYQVDTIAIDTGVALTRGCLFVLLAANLLSVAAYGPVAYMRAGHRR